VAERKPGADVRFRAPNNTSGPLVFEFKPLMQENGRGPTLGHAQFHYHVGYESSWSALPSGSFDDLTTSCSSSDQAREVGRQIAVISFGIPYTTRAMAGALLLTADSCAEIIRTLSPMPTAMFDRVAPCRGLDSARSRLLSTVRRAFHHVFADMFYGATG